MRRGRLIVIAGPSGVGKGSIVRELLSRDPEGLVRSVSATTRGRRPEEVDGVDYLFVSEDEFDRMIGADAFLEWAEVFSGDRYGTPLDQVERALAEGRDVVLEIDVQGAAQVRDREPDSLLVLLTAPSMDELERRLRGRATETEGKLAERLAKAEWELSQAGWFDHVVVNDALERASDEVAAIIGASRSTP